MSNKMSTDSQKYGILVDYEWCSGCHTCETACQMEHGLPHDQFGIKLSEVGPWEYADGKWQYAYLPIPTEQCDLCATRREKDKLPTCVKHCQAKCLSFGTLTELVEQLASKPTQTLFHIKNA